MWLATRNLDDPQNHRAVLRHQSTPVKEMPGGRTCISKTWEPALFHGSNGSQSWMLHIEAASRLARPITPSSPTAKGLSALITASISTWQSVPSPGHCFTQDTTPLSPTAIRAVLPRPAAHLEAGPAKHPALASAIRLAWKKWSGPLCPAALVFRSTGGRHCSQTSQDTTFRPDTTRHVCRLSHTAATGEIPTPSRSTDTN